MFFFFHFIYSIPILCSAKTRSAVTLHRHHPHAVPIQIQIPFCLKAKNKRKENTRKTINDDFNRETISVKFILKMNLKLNTFIRLIFFFFFQLSLILFSCCRWLDIFGG